MCVLSAVTPVMQQQWLPPAQMDLGTAYQLAEIIRRLDILDNKLGAMKCGPDAAKDKYIAELTARIVELSRQKKTPQRDSRGAKGKR